MPSKATSPHQRKKRLPVWLACLVFSPKSSSLIHGFSHPYSKFRRRQLRGQQVDSVRSLREVELRNFEQFHDKTANPPDFLVATRQEVNGKHTASPTETLLARAYEPNGHSGTHINGDHVRYVINGGHHPIDGVSATNRTNGEYNVQPVETVDIKPSSEEGDQENTHYTSTAERNHSEIVPALVLKEDENYYILAPTNETGTVSPVKGRRFSWWNRRSPEPVNNTSEVGKVSEAKPLTFRSIWKPRHARSAAEGIRREKTNQLSSVLKKASGSFGKASGRFASRTLTGLIVALAEEANDLEVKVDARPDTPFWGKHVDTVKISFSRLGFKPLRMGGLESAIREYEANMPDDPPSPITSKLTDLSNADEAFNSIDVDNSGALDSDELARALNLASIISAESSNRTMAIIKNLASELVKLYDFNGDGVVDRMEYQSMVEDMAALRQAQNDRLREHEDRIAEKRTQVQKNVTGWLSNVTGWMTSSFESVGGVVGGVVGGILNRNHTRLESGVNDVGVPTVRDEWKEKDSLQHIDDLVDISDSPDIIDSVEKAVGSITISDLKLDLRRLVFGAIPLLKHITPGGPLILEPFTATVNGSFNREDILNSSLLDAGLRRLVARALRRRVGSLRDLFEGAVFHGRSWKMFGEKAPVVEVPKLSDIEFDDENRLIITGRARVQANPGAVVIENAFKVRTRIGTRRGGRTIRLVDPELALVLECPQSFEEKLAAFCSFFNIRTPARPKPIYAFFPIYSPFKVDDNDGFDLGEDNCINAIYIQNGALRFEMSAVLRPGRFLGSHYIAFTVPNRTFIVTLDRVKAGIRAARKAKKEAHILEQAVDRRSRARKKIETAIEASLTRESKQRRPLSIVSKRVQPKSFFSRFVDGYIQAERDETAPEEVTAAIKDFFGRQGSNSL